MNFHEYQTTHQHYKQAGRDRSVPESDFIERELKSTMSHAMQMASSGQDERAPAISHLQLCTERDWLEAGRPYYKVWPDLLPYFINTKLNVPSEFLQLPFPAISIRLPETHDIDVLRTGKLQVRSILIGSKPKEDLAIMFDNSAVGKFPTIADSSRQLILWIDTGEYDEIGLLDPSTGNIQNLRMPAYVYQQLLFDSDDQTIEQRLDLLNKVCRQHSGNMVLDGGAPIPIELTGACLRIAVAVAFLATGADKLLEADVLNRDLQRYLLAKQIGDEETETKCLDRARRNRKFGWNIGRDLPFPSRQTSDGGEEHETSEGKELQYQHQRSAHWHWVRYGPGKAKMTLKFFKQMTVRADLPVDTKAKRGYSSGQKP